MPHRLYGHVDAAENYSVGRWCADARAALDDAGREGRLPILVGGTGLYFKALTQGLRGAADPRRNPRRGARAAATPRAPAALHAELARRDPAAAAGSSPATGRASPARSKCWRRPAVRWPTGTATACRRCSIADERVEAVSRRRPRRARAAGSTRASTPCWRGALDEVRALAARGLDPLLPAMKAHGVPWLRRASRAARSRSPRPPKAASPTPAATPSARSPGSGTRCRDWTLGRRRSRRQSAALDLCAKFGLTVRRSRV